ncbi:hypothetical protein POTOM_015224 [Populus tomentosa]|uniref:Uncharacterized protein n=1 Tax=Populus tomentosa TaxID=118781 RepID=A0A8X8A1H5_POPTO|nr:hypothetical protein POTOM_015224 [Populus tomentosa]
MQRSSPILDVADYLRRSQRIIPHPTTRNIEAFPAIPEAKKRGLLFTCRKQGVTTIGPRKTGLCGLLQKAFVKGDI